MLNNARSLARITPGPAYFQYARRISQFSPTASENDGEDDVDYRRRRKTEWKRRQKGQTFLDNLIVTVRGGKGGDGCVAFHREKFKPFGPPSGGNGGRGGDVYILPTPELSNLSTVPKRVRAAPGGNGRGTWMHGRNAPPTIIRVPVGTVVREIDADDSRRAQDEWEAEEESLEGLDPEERVQRLRERRWVHYPGAEDNNLQREAFQEAEMALYRQEREQRRMLREQGHIPVFLDLDSEPNTPSTSSAPTDTSATSSTDNSPGYLVASGGSGGVGNPYFLTSYNRSPKFATRGSPGERKTLALELKLLADVGLVGLPNAGKSTLLRALTRGRARVEVAGYAFTTLNPAVAVVRVGRSGGVLFGEGGVVEDTEVEVRRERDRLEYGEETDGAAVGGNVARMEDEEVFRFTIADNPGLIAQASENVGLGHSFLRSIERALALVYVVDLSGPSPETDLRVLRDELDAYKPGLSGKARMVIANKADLLGASGEDEGAGDDNGDATGGKSRVEEAREKLRSLEEFVKHDFTHLDVVPISAKYSQNLTKALVLLRGYVEEAKADCN